MTELFKYFSIYATAIPIILSLLKIKRNRLVAGLFFFLAVGLMTELLMEFGNFSIKENYALFSIYCLIEFSFFLFVVGKFVAFIPKLILKDILYISLPLWIVCIYIYPKYDFLEISGISLFNLVYEVMISLLAGYVLIKMVENNESVGISFEFWLLLGIFFYCFSTFFIMIFLETAFTHNIWFAHNVINILTYILYSISLNTFKKINLL